MESRAGITGNLVLGIVVASGTVRLTNGLTFHLKIQFPAARKVGYPEFSKSAQTVAITWIQQYHTAHFREL
jgi:hypothetical protein